MVFTSRGRAAAALALARAAGEVLPRGRALIAPALLLDERLGLLFGLLLLDKPILWADLAGIVPVALGIVLVTRAPAARAAAG